MGNRVQASSDRKCSSKTLLSSSSKSTASSRVAPAQKWVEGHEIRLRVHLLPFFGELGVSEVSPGKVQEYRVHRMSSRGEVNPHSKSKNPPKDKAPSRSTLHNEIVTLRLVLKNAVRHGKLSHVPDLSPPYRTQGKIEHRPWFSPEEYKQLYTATRAYAKEPFHDTYKWNAEQLHDYVLFMANTGLRPDEVNNLQHRDVVIVDDQGSGREFLKSRSAANAGRVSVRACHPLFVLTSDYWLARSRFRARRDARLRGGVEKGEQPPTPQIEYPQPTDPVFPGSNVKIFNNLLRKEGLKTDRDGKNRTAYSLRHTYICMRLSEGANIYDIARNCRTSVEMIQKFYAAHIKDLLDAASINVMLNPEGDSPQATCEAGSGGRLRRFVTSRFQGTRVPS